MSDRPAPDPQPTAPSGAVVAMRALRFAWPGRDAFTLAIDDFMLAPRQRLLLLGPSGSGKSTFLSLLCGIIQPTSGEVRILGEDMTRLPSRRRDAFRAEHFGIVFQMFNLLPYGSIRDNVLLPLSFAPHRRARAEAAGGVEAESQRLLHRLGIDDTLAGKRASALSVGQQQRVAAARALIGRPEIIVADEPTSALDRDRQQAFLDLLFTEIDAAGSSLIMVSHDTTLASRFDRVVAIADILAPVPRAPAAGAVP